jgi:hypothetical protein
MHPRNKQTRIPSEAQQLKKLPAFSGTPKVLGLPSGLFLTFRLSHQIRRLLILILQTSFVLFTPFPNKHTML